MKENYLNDLNDFFPIWIRLEPKIVIWLFENEMKRWAGRNWFNSNEFFN